MKLTDVYKSILSYCSLSPNEQGEIQVTLAENKLKTDIEGKRIVMPTKDNLKNFNPESELVFHPFREYFNRGESLIVKKLRHTLNIRINYVLLTLMDDLLSIIMSPALHAKFTPRQRELLMAVGDVPATARVKFIEEMITKRLKAAPRAAILNIYLKKSGMYQNKRHPRVGVTTFPVYEYLTNERPAGLSKDAAAAIMRLVEYILPGSKDDPESYNSYSDSQDIPWLECMLNTGYTITSRIEEVTTLFANFLEEKPYRNFDHLWLDEILNLGRYKKEVLLIPDQAGNDGALNEKQTQPASRQNTQYESVVHDAFRQEERPRETPAQNTVSRIEPISTYNTEPRRDSQLQAPMQQIQPGPEITPEGKLDFTKVQTPATMIAGSIQTPLTQADQYQQMLALYNQVSGNPSAMMNIMAANGYQGGGMIPGMMQPGMMTPGMNPAVMAQMLQQQQMMQMMQRQQQGNMMPGMMQPGMLTC